MANNDFINAGIITINIVINSPNKIIVINDVFLDVSINPSINNFESFRVIASCNTDAPPQSPNIVDITTIENVINIPVMANPKAPDITSSIVFCILPAPDGNIFHPENIQLSKVNGNKIKSIDNFTNISRKYNGIGNNAVKYNPKISKPVNANGKFGKIGIPHIILCI